MTVTLSTTTKISLCKLYRALPVCPKDVSSKMRRFRAADQQEIQRIYLEAHKSFIFSAFISGLQKPYVFTPALLIAQIVAMTTESTLIAVHVLAFLVLVIYVSYRIKFMKHVEHSLSTDLADIDGFYQSGKDKSSFWVFEIDGRLVGFVGIVQRNETDVELQRLTVAPEFRRRGIGERMCRRVIALYKQKQFQRLVLECTEVHIAGKNLYTKLGFDVKECVVDPLALSAITLEHYSLSLT